MSPACALKPLGGKGGYRAVIFDLDGTLIDSEGNYYLADKQFLANHGIDYTDEFRARMVGRGHRELLRIMHEEYGVSENDEVLGEEKNRIYLEIARKETKAFAEMALLLDFLQAQSVPLAIASGSSPEVIEELCEIAGIASYFEVLLSSEEVPESKPAPDVFLEAARRLAVEPGDCLVFEDSRFGVRAALNAGMDVVAIPTITEPPLHDDFFKATCLFEGGMSTFTAERMMDLLKNA